MGAIKTGEFPMNTGIMQRPQVEDVQPAQGLGDKGKFDEIAIDAGALRRPLDREGVEGVSVDVTGRTGLRPEESPAQAIYPALAIYMGRW